MTAALGPLANACRWVCWRNETRVGKLTKVPYGARGRRAKAGDPQTWISRTEAEQRAVHLVNGAGGGIGVQLGDLGTDHYLAGIDLDSCIDDEKRLAVWADNVLAGLPTYAEVSPSGHGVKAFFRVAAKDVRPFLDLIGVAAAQWGTKRGVPGYNGADHGPGVEVYLSHRYFAVTERLLTGQPDHIAILDWDTLQRLAQLIPKKKPGPDTSRSAKAFGAAAQLYRASKITTFDEMVAALRNHADPEIQAWVREKGDAEGGRQLRNIWEKIKPDALPQIFVEPGKRHEAADLGMAALVAAAVPFYQRGRSLQRIAVVKAKNTDGKTIFVPGILPVDTPMMERMLGRHAHWSTPWRNEIVTIDPPAAVAQQILSMTGHWPFPPLTGIVQCPTLRRDGSLLATEGYDDVTGLVLTSAIAMPRIPQPPTFEEAQSALALLSELLEEFPFDDEASKAVALSMLITPVLRGGMSVAPVHLVTKPTPGTGGSYLADCAAMIATGEQLPVEAMAATYEETEKRLVGSLLAGFPIIGIDNCRGTIAGDLFCQIAERPAMSIRALGKSEKFRIANNFCLFINGNNVTVAEDMVRRTLRCRLDANLEHPENRQFKRDPLTTITEARGKYVAAALTLPCAYLAAGRPQKLPTLASYADWCRTVREPLVWLGCADPVATQDKLRGDDPRKAEVEAAFGAWRLLIGVGKQHSRVTKDLISFASEHLNRSLFEAFFAVAPVPSQNTINPQKLGVWLHRHEGTIAANSKLCCDTSDRARPRWYLDFATR